MRITSKRALAIYALIGAFLIGVVFLIGSFAVNGKLGRSSALISTSSPAEA